jgi:hypothetical protein
MSCRKNTGAVLCTGSTNDRLYEKPAYDATPGKCIIPLGGLGYADRNGSGTTCDALPNAGGMKRMLIPKYQKGVYDADIVVDPPNFNNEPRP